MGHISQERLNEICAFADVNGDVMTCAEFGISQDTLDRYKRGYSETAEDQIKLSREITQDGQTLTIRSYEIRDLDQLLSYCKVDLEKWEVTRHVVNSWGSRENECFQVKAWLSRRKAPRPETWLKAFVEDAQKHAPVYDPIGYTPLVGNLLEIAIPDIHYGLLAWGLETGSANYDLAIARKTFMYAVHRLISYAQAFPVERIIFPIGNDYFNVNSMLNVTGAGTPQDEDDRFQKSFYTGRRMAVEAIDTLQHIAPVDVVIVPGNHDPEKSFYLGDSLECWYHNCSEVTVDNSPRQRKYKRFGKCLIGYTHGNQEKFKDLPVIMATEVPQDWANTAYREWHLGHFHQTRVPIDEIRGIRVRILPSLAPESAWSARKGYNHLREAKALIWNRDEGLIAEFNHHPVGDIDLDEN